MNRLLRRALLASALLACADAAQAHITLDAQALPAGTTQRIALRVGHGCEGVATTGVRMQIPAGMRDVKPMPKPGWTLEAKTGPLAQPYQDHGRTVSEGVTEIAWSGGNLPDAFYDEFVLRGRLPDTPGQTLHFKVVQECGGKVSRWIAIPQPGQPEPPEPAPALKLLPRP